MPTKHVTESECRQIAEILNRRANEIASFKRDMEENVAKNVGSKIEFYALPGSVELALSREMQRLRKLADKLLPPEDESEDE